MTNLDSFSWSDHMSLQAPAETQLSGLISAADHRQVFGSPKASDQASLQASETAIFPSGTLDFSRYSNIYAVSAQTDSFQNAADSVCGKLGVAGLKINGTDLSLGNGGAYNDGLTEPLFTSPLVDGNPDDLIGSYVSNLTSGDQSQSNGYPTSSLAPEAVRDALETDVPLASGQLVRADKLAVAISLYTNEFQQMWHQ